MLCAALVLGASQVYLSLAAQGVGLPKLLLTQIVVGVPAFLAASLLFEHDPWVTSEHLALSVLYQGVVIAGFGFIGNLWLLKHYLPSGVSALSLTTPVWGVLLSHVVLGEGAGAALFGGLALVLAGSAVVRWGAAQRR